MFNFFIYLHYSYFSDVNKYRSTMTSAKLNDSVEISNPEKI